jgi:hypothetical protein
MPRKANTVAPAASPELVNTFKTLHKLFLELIELKPWELVHESVLLGVRHPATDEIYYAYFMGELGEVVGFNLYDATNVAYWRHTLERLQQDEDSFSPSSMLSHTFLQLTAGKKSGLPKEVIALHEAAGITVPRGKAGYLEPVDYRAGYAPALPADEPLQLASDVIPGFIYTLKTIDQGIHVEAEQLAEQGIGLVASKNEHNRWELMSRPLPAPKEPDMLSVDIPGAAIWDPLRSLPRSGDAYAFHAELLPAPFLDETRRGVYPIMFLCVSLQQRMILQVSQVPAPDWRCSAADALVAMLKSIGQLPKRIVIADRTLQSLLDACGAAVSTPVSIDASEGAAAIDAFDFIADRMGL